MTRVFNSELLIRRRQQVGHSTLTLAAHLGVTPSVVRAVEGGADTGRYELRILDRYAAALGIQFADLFLEPAATPRKPADVADVVAVLLQLSGPVRVDVVAGALRWPPERVLLALDAADDAIAEVGLRLSWHSDVAVTLVPAVLMSEAPGRAVSMLLAEHGVGPSEAALLLDLMAKGSLQYNPHQVQVARLLAAGVVTQARERRAGNSRAGTRARLELSAETRYNLCLS